MLSLCFSTEPIIVEVTFRNPLKVSLALSNLSLLWKFSADGTSTTDELAGGAITNEDAPDSEVDILHKSRNGDSSAV